MKIKTLFTLALVGASLLSTQAQDRSSQARAYLLENARQYGLSQQDLQDLVVKDEYTSARNGLTHIYMRQRWQGIEVFNGELAVHIAANGSVVTTHSNAVADIRELAADPTPKITPEVALAMVLSKYLPEVMAPEPTSTENALHKYNFSGDHFSGEEPFVQLHYLKVGDELPLVWNVNFYQPDGSHWWNIRIDAHSGKELDRDDWVAECAFDHSSSICSGDHPAPLAPAPAAPNDYNIYPMPVESPSHGSRILHNAPWTLALNASPFGWHDTDGATGAEFTITRGNNVHAQEDQDGNNGTGYSPDGTANLDFDFPIDLTQAPLVYEDAAITNLFYWNNIIHDVLYQYGFDEVSGNFQQNNYGNGGLGNDYVFADAQDGSGTNNANFGTPADGGNPRMQMFLWTAPTPDRDGDLDNGIIVHEYGHGVSNRLVGGPSNASCLGNAEQMGEGWSDYLSLMLTLEPGDMGTDPRGIGTYALNEPVTGGGIRPSPYSTNFTVNSYTYGNTNSGVSQPHGIGFVWCTILWEMTWDLIDAHGFDPDIYNGTGGNNIALQLVMDGLKLTPCQPGFVDGRDAIIQADQINNGGANFNLLWSAFARRGLGFSASQGSSGSRSDQVEAFDLPVDIDLSIQQIFSPIGGTMLDCMNAPSQVSVQLANTGQMNQTGIPVGYQLDSDPIVSETYAPTLLAGNSIQYDFTPIINISTPGQHVLKVWSAFTGDQNPANDTMTVIIDLITSTPISGSIYEDFEGETACSTASDCGTSQCPLTGNWSNVPNGTGDDVDWRVDAGGTPSTGTGPSVDHAPGTSIGNYVYMETSGGACASNEAHLLSGCIDLSSAVAPELSLWYHMFGGDQGSLHVDVFSNGSWVNDVITPVNGNQGNAWIPMVVGLTSFVGETVVLRIRGITGAGFESDLALDDIRISEPPTCPAPFQASVAAILVNSAEISWSCTSCTGTTVVEYGPSGFTQGTGLTILGAATPQPITGLSSGTDYDAYIYQDCGGGDISFSTSVISFRTLPSCGDGWYDTGGPLGQHSNNENYIFTICPANSGDVITIAFTAFNLETNYDALYVFDGPDTSATKIASANAAPSSGNIYGPGGYWGTTIPGPFTSTHPSGCLTFAFSSDGSVVRDGWEAIISCTSPDVQLQLRAFLEGPYVEADGRMHDSLRVRGFLPLAEPYSAMSFTQVGSGGETVQASVLANTDLNDAVVDWVLVELRDGIDATQIIATTNALIQRDGDVVALDGSSPVPLPIGPGEYYVALRHRSHLATMTSSAVVFGNLPIALDLTLPATVTYGSEGQKNMSGIMALWTGNIVLDGELKYTGASNDRDPILQTIGGSVPTAVLDGYNQEDGNMDGTVKYTGAGNDRDPILVNIGGSIPTNVRPEQLP